MFNLLLTAPYSFVLTQSFTFLPKSTAQRVLSAQYSRMRNAQDLAVSQAEELKDALDQLTSNEFVMGDHHLTLQVLADPLRARRRRKRGRASRACSITYLNARSILAETGMVVAREDLALGGGLLGAASGQFRLSQPQGADHQPQFRRHVAVSQFPALGGRPAIIGAMRLRC